MEPDLSVAQIVAGHMNLRGNFDRPVPFQFWCPVCAKVLDARADDPTGSVAEHVASHETGIDLEWWDRAAHPEEP